MASVDWVKPTVELIKALSHFAWPVVVGLGLWHFRMEITALIGRILKVKAWGAELELEAKKELDAARAIGSKDLQQKEALVEKAAAEITSADGVALMELALTDPRQAALRSFYLMARAIIVRAFDPAPVPVDSVLDAAIEQLTAKAILNDRLRSQIGALRKFHHSVRNGYTPTTDEAAEFVFLSTSVREDLGDKSIIT